MGEKKAKNKDGEDSGESFSTRDKWVLPDLGGQGEEHKQPSSPWMNAGSLCHPGAEMGKPNLGFLSSGTRPVVEASSDCLVIV